LDGATSQAISSGTHTKTMAMTVAKKTVPKSLYILSNL